MYRFPVFVRAEWAQSALIGIERNTIHLIMALQGVKVPLRPIGAQTNASRASNSVPARTTSPVMANPEAHLRKLFGGDEKKVKAALTIRHWLKRQLLLKRERKLGEQFATLKTQHELMLTNPQHFQDTQIESLIEISPLLYGNVLANADPYRTMIESTDAMIRSELRRHAGYVPIIASPEQSQDFKSQLQQIEVGRREILQVYAQRVKLMSNMAPNTTQKEAQSINTENAENMILETVTDAPPMRKKVKRQVSLRWADSAGQPLSQSQVFDLEDVVIRAKSPPAV